MSPRRHKTSPVLTDQVAADALGQIMSMSGASPLPQVRPSLQDVALDRIVEGSEFQTRDEFNPQKDRQDAELIESVRDVGVRVPVHVQDLANGKYRLTSGHRRLIAARLAGLHRIPAVVSPPGSDAFDSALDTWLENLHRKDLSPLERSKMLQLLIERFDLPRSADTACRLGLSKSSYYRYLGLLEAPEDVKKALASGVLGVALAEKIATIDDGKVRGRVIQAANAGVPARRIDQVLDEYRNGEPISDHLAMRESVSRRDGHRGGAQGPGKAWAKSKMRELIEVLEIRANSIARIEKDLQARRISSAHATAAALLVAHGDPAKDALESVATLDRSAVRAVANLFKVIYRARSSAGQPAGRTVLHRILEVLIDRLETGGSADTGS